MEHAFWMKKEGYKPSTIERRAKIESALGFFTSSRENTRYI